jgi:CO/xanthine dehydrogenase Mo-binding subunit
MIKANHRVAIYLRVSTLDQTTANQERELREVASRMGCEIVKVYRDHGVSEQPTRPHVRYPSDCYRNCCAAANRRYVPFGSWAGPIARVERL